jgi:hypothetical protein
MIRDTITTARRCGATGPVLVRADSAYCSAAIITAISTAGARFSVGIGMNPNVRRAIAAIHEEAWTRITYPQAIPDPQTGELVAAAEVAEIAYTAFTSKPRSQQVTARLIVRRIPELNKAKLAGQDPLFPLFRYHAIFTDNPADLITAEAQHRGHAIIEQVIADLKHSALAHLPSGRFTANAAWLVAAAIAFNLTRALGVADRFTKATTATIRAKVINTPARYRDPRASSTCTCLELALGRSWLGLTTPHDSDHLNPATSPNRKTTDTTRRPHQHAQPATPHSTPETKSTQKHVGGSGFAPQPHQRRAYRHRPLRGRAGPGDQSPVIASPGKTPPRRHRHPQHHPTALSASACLHRQHRRHHIPSSTGCASRRAPALRPTRRIYRHHPPAFTGGDNSRPPASSSLPLAVIHHPAARGRPARVGLTQPTTRACITIAPTHPRHRLPRDPERTADTRGDSHHPTAASHYPDPPTGFPCMHRPRPHRPRSPLRHLSGGPTIHPHRGAQRHRATRHRQRPHIPASNANPRARDATATTAAAAPTTAPTAPSEPRDAAHQRQP